MLFLVSFFLLICVLQVTSNFPLSKAYNLFTLLGLRWIVVVNLEGGTVVGILTRESFLDSHVKEKTGIDVNDLLS